MLQPSLIESILIVLTLTIIWFVYRIYIDVHGDDERRGQLRQLQNRLGENQNLLEQLERRLHDLQSQSTAANIELRERLLERVENLKQTVGENLAGGRTQLAQSFAELREELGRGQSAHQTAFEQRQTDALKTLHEGLHNGMQGVQSQVRAALHGHSQELGKRIEQLALATEQRLNEISGRVDQRLSEGFERTTQVFTDVLKRLALIDEAQKKITELSTNVVSLQEVLADKRSRGAFGEVQLNSLVRNVLPESGFALQHSLPNGTIADCVLFLPEPTGQVAVDAKFPLESFRTMTDIEISEIERKAAERTFKTDIRKHIRDIAEKYIIAGITSDGAVMFIPAEAVFAEIQAHHPDLVEEAARLKVWMVSPTTLWAILNTARAVLKDAATREQVNVIQEHLGYLAKDFERFQTRMDTLARHIKQANDDVQGVSTSARKISERFGRIERVELDSQEPQSLEKTKDIS